MKTFSVVVAVAVMLTFICVHKSSAERDDGYDDWRSPAEPEAENSFVAGYQEIPEDSWKMPYEIRHRKCRFCCQCCPRMRGCGICCRF